MWNAGEVIGELVMRLVPNLHFVRLAIVCIVLGACATEQFQRTSSFDDWSVFGNDGLFGKNCWVATTAIAKPRRFADGQIFIIVTTQTKEFSVVSEHSRFRADVGSVVIGDKRYEMIFEGTKGWTTDIWSDTGILRNLASASNNRIEVGGEFFEFSSLGYAQAFAEASTHCAG